MRDDQAFYVIEALMRNLPNAKMGPTSDGRIQIEWGWSDCTDCNTIIGDNLQDMAEWVVRR